MTRLFPARAMPTVSVVLRLAEANCRAARAASVATRPQQERARTSGTKLRKADKSR